MPVKRQAQGSSKRDALSPVATPPFDDPALRADAAIGQRVRKIRKALRLTQTQFADRIGVTQGTVSAIETAHYPPGLDIGHKICDAVDGITLDYIFRGNTGGLPLKWDRYLASDTPLPRGSA